MCTLEMLNLQLNTMHRLNLPAAIVVSKRRGARRELILLASLVMTSLFAFIVGLKNWRRI